MSVSGGYLVIPNTTGSRQFILQNSTNYPLMAIGTVAIYARSYSSPVNSSVGNNRLVSLADSTEANRVAMTGSGAVDTVLANTAQAGTQTQIGTLVQILMHGMIFIFYPQPHQLNFIQDGTLLDTITTNIPTVSTLGAQFRQGNFTNPSVTYIDWVFIRQYLATEPAWGSWGSDKFDK